MKKIFLSILLSISVSFLFASNEYSLFKSNGKYGLIDSKQKIVLDAEYEEIKFNEVYLCKKNKQEVFIYDNKMNLIHQFDNDTNKIVMTSPWVFYINKGYAANQTWNLYNLLSNETIEAHDEFFEGNISGEPWIAGRFSFYSKDLQKVSNRYQCVYPYRNNRAVVLIEQEKGQIIDEKFSVVLDHIYATADYYCEGLIPIVLYDKNNLDSVKKSYYADINGNIIYECDFDFNIIGRDTIKHIQTLLVHGSFNENVAVVQKSDKSWFVLDKKFNKYYLPENCTVESDKYSNGLLLISKKINDEKKYGFVDKNCNLVIPCDFSYAESFFGKYAIVIKDNTEGIIDAKGKFIPVYKLKK